MGAKLSCLHNRNNPKLRDAANESSTSQGLFDANSQSHLHTKRKHSYDEISEDHFVHNNNSNPRNPHLHHHQQFQQVLPESVYENDAPKFRPPSSRDSSLTANQNGLSTVVGGNGNESEEDDDGDYCSTPNLAPRNGKSLPSFDNGIYSNADDTGHFEVSTKSSDTNRAIERYDSLYSKPQKKKPKSPAKPVDLAVKNNPAKAEEMKVGDREPSQLQYVEVEFCSGPRGMDGAKKRVPSPVNYTDVMTNEDGTFTIVNEQTYSN